MKYFGRAAALSLLMLACPALWPQVAVSTPATPEAQPEPPKDSFGRISPRGTVMGFLNAARKGNIEVATLYLNTPLRGAAAEDLARQLAIVLDRRLPARLNKLSDQPEGSIPDLLRPNEDLVGTISTSKGDLDIMVERVDRGKAGQVWLFSRKSLESIPDVFEELSTRGLEEILPKFLVNTRLAYIPLFEWLALLVGVPFLYFVTGFLDRLISPVVGAIRRHMLKNPAIHNPHIFPPPVRLLLLALCIVWLLSMIELPLLARQFWSTAAMIIAITSCAWLLMRLNGWGEGYLRVRRGSNLSGSAPVLRLVRRVLDGLVLFAALLFTLHHFGINPTAALAGLGVGGIAVALAAQKTLENAIGGISLIADQVIRVGDFLKLGDVSGTIEEVGLRSTRIRTLDRTLVSVPNGQIATMSIETVSARDKFWFHPVVGLRYETTPAQIRSVVTGVRQLLSKHPAVDTVSVRVQFQRFGPSSLDLDISAYVLAADWNVFVQIQEELLLSVMDLVHEAGAEIALPSQTMYLSAHSSDKRLQLTAAAHGRKRAG